MRRERPQHPWSRRLVRAAVNFDMTSLPILLAATVYKYQSFFCVICCVIPFCRPVFCAPLRPITVEWGHCNLLKSDGLRYYDYLVDNQPAEDKMKPETAKQPGTILDGQRKQKHAAATRVAQEQDQEAKNLADFSAKKEQVIKPSFQEIIEMFKARELPIYMRQ